ncbi:MAG: PTS fructose transporter subunit IIA [Acidobacteria bacterium]|nr:MAG: PTS fructose transporter subunit IIA [Acidobacteriota bacterium]
MKLSDVVSEDLILPSLQGIDASSVLKEFADAICSTGKCSDPQALFDRLYEREQQESTGIGNGVAIPHCKIDNLKDVLVGIGYSESGVDFNALDGKPIHFFFVVVSPSNASVMHLRTLAALSRLLKSQNFLSYLRQRPPKADLISRIKKEEEGATVSP